MLLPGGAPLNIYDFACWARQTVAALTVVSAYRPVRPLPFGLDELRTRRLRAPSARRCARRRGWFGLLDRVLHALRAAAPRAAAPARA